MAMADEQKEIPVQEEGNQPNQEIAQQEKKSPIKFLLAAFYVGLSAKTR